MTLPSRTQEGASAKNEPGREEGAASVDLQNTFIVWRAKSGDRQGEWLDFSLANRPRRAPKDATTVTLTPKEAAYLRQSWPMEKGLDPAARAPRAETRAWFLLATEDERAALIAEHEAVADAAELAAREEQAEREAQAAAERQRLAAEIESFRPKFTAIGHEFGFDMHVRMWQKDGLSGEAILIRLPGLLEKRTAEYERQRTRDEYADRFHDGKSRAARDYVSYQTSGHEPDMIAFMRAALAQGTNVPSQMTVS